MWGEAYATQIGHSVKEQFVPGRCLLSMISGRWLFLFALMLAMLVTPRRLASQGLLGKPASMMGKLIEQPEEFSGLWETPTGPGHAVGIWLQLTTRIEGAATVLIGVAQYEQSFSVTLFQRIGNQLEFGDNSAFADRPDDVLAWDGKHLRARRGSRNNDALTTEIDLTFDASMERWSGFYRRGSFAKVVTLRRSGSVSTAAPSTIAGTWANTDKWYHGCFHIAQLSDGSYAGWSDSLQTPGTYRYGNGLRPPTSTAEHYGNLMRVTNLGRQQFATEFVSLGICCSTTAIATLVGHDSLSGTWHPGMNQAGGKFLWKRLSGKSCRVEEQ